MARRPLNGARNINGDTASHARYGVGPSTDYGADTGEGVYAPISGWVTHWWSNTGGWSVAVTSAAWKVTMQHNSGYRGPSSGWVAEGTLIAVVGSTGSATTGPHVHMWIQRAKTGANRASYEGWLRDFMGWKNTARNGGRVPGPFSYSLAAATGTPIPATPTESENMSDYVYASRTNPATKKGQWMLIHPTDFPDGVFITDNISIANGFAGFTGDSYSADETGRWEGLIKTAKIVSDAAWARIAKIAAMSASVSTGGGAVSQLSAEAVAQELIIQLRP